MIILEIFLIIALFLLFYSFINIKNKDYIDKLINNYENRRDKRKKKDQLSFVDRIDIMRENLNISLASEIMIVLFLVISIMVTYLSFNFINIKIINFGLFPITFMFCYLILKQVYKGKFDILDKQAIVLVNIMLNMLETNDDIVEIIRKSTPFLQGNLKKYCEQFVIETRNLGIEEGFNNLKSKVHSKRLKILIKNLYISSKHEADYNKILKKSKNIFNDYFRMKEKRKKKIRNGRNTIILLIALAVVIFNMIQGFSTNMVQNLISTGTGQLIILYFVFLGNFILYQFIKIDTFNY